MRAEPAAGEGQRDIDGAEGRPVEDSSSSGGNRDMDGADGRPGAEVRCSKVAKGDCGRRSGRMWIE